MAGFELRTYVDEDGRASFETWILELDGQAQAKVTIALSRLELGNMSNVEAVGEGVSELKLNWGAGIPGVFQARRQDYYHPVVRRHEETAKPGHCRRQSPVGELQVAQARNTKMSEC
jgi:putative addiction module killer protein